MTTVQRFWMLAAIVGVLVARPGWADEAVEARLETIEAHSQLARALGVQDPPQSLLLNDTLPVPHNWSMSPEVLQTIALENRLDLQIVEQSVAEAEARAREERVRFLKSVQTGVAWERFERPPSGTGSDRSPTAIGSREEDPGPDPDLRGCVGFVDGNDRARHPAKSGARAQDGPRGLELRGRTKRGAQHRARKREGGEDGADPR